MKAGIYARSATGDAAQLREQEARCRAYASAHGWEVAAVWADEGSGLSDDRSGLRALRKAMATKRVEAVVATDAARLARDTRLLADLCAAAEHAETTIVLVDEGINSMSLCLLGEAWNSARTLIPRTTERGAKR
jgi:DNA invertase Pin-like site-specific DNA recombinase